MRVGRVEPRQFWTAASMIIQAKSKHDPVYVKHTIDLAIWSVGVHPGCRKFAVFIPEPSKVKPKLKMLLGHRLSSYIEFDFVKDLQEAETVEEAGNILRLLVAFKVEKVVGGAGFQIAKEKIKKVRSTRRSKRFDAKSAKEFIKRLKKL